MRRLAVVLLLVAACGVRTPARIDLNAMIAARGAEQARRELVVRVLDDPRDVQARLALAELAETMRRPSEAIEQLEAVLRLGGPLGTRWRDADRQRLARLLHKRAQLRAARGAATALHDFERARELGIAPASDEHTFAKYLVAVAQVRHVEAKERAKGRAALAALFKIYDAVGLSARRAGSLMPVQPSQMEIDSIGWRGAQANARPEDRAWYGGWLWAMGARREAWEQLSAWHAATKSPRDPVLQGFYLRALVWWSPVWLGEARLPPAEDLVGPERCLFPGVDCTADAAPAAQMPAAPTPAAPTPPAPTPAAPTPAAPTPATPTPATPTPATPTPATPTPATPTPAQPPAARAPVEPSSGGAASASTDATPATTTTAIDGEPRAIAAARFAAYRFAALPPLAAAQHDDLPELEAAAGIPPRPRPAYLRPRITSVDLPMFDVEVPALADVGAPELAQLVPIAAAFYRDAGIAERLGRDLVASSHDAAIAHATLGALFDALGDPARARAAWQAAVDASPEPVFVRGLAEAAARTGDGSAAIVFATQAAAAWGDPAVVWTSVAAALTGAGQHVSALTAARSALDLAGPEALPRALDVAIAASRALDRKGQAEALVAQRAQLAPRGKTDDADARAAISEHRERPTASTVERLWEVSRAAPRDVELRAALLAAVGADDPRRATLVAELVALAGDPDPDRALAAVAALRR